ncbi:hypothetical protein BDV93DRAFT_527451 [Ceratobasidium sp. AG-I]|nr:hypothetical protein BDV93DRAFT_527451 [Ceratobasidium sp. AG-I]
MGINVQNNLTTGCHISIQAILPSGYDRFATPIPAKVGLEVDSQYRLTWVVVEARESVQRVHPEGGVYFHLGNIVSDRPITGEMQVLGTQLTQEYNTSANGTNITLFLKETDTGFQYYFANHSTKSICWLNGEQPEAMYEVANNRVANTLTQEYWNHAENFPAPTFTNEADLKLIQNVLAGLAVDASTSDGSTSPFPPAQIAQFLHILDSFKGKSDEFQTYTIARLWSMIWYTRLVNNYGTSEACLDRFTPMTDCPPTFTNNNILLARLMFGFGPQTHLMRATRAWCGRIAYVSEWRVFKGKNESEWKQVIELACVLGM